MVSWVGPEGENMRAFVADFLESRQEHLGQTELSSSASFFYVVVRRALASEGDTGEIGSGTPIAEFGYGSPPACPEGWPLAELATLLRAAIDELRHGRSPESSHDPT